MKKIRKTYSGVVPNGKVLNSRNDSLQDTYSSDYLNRHIPDINDLGEIIVDDVACKNIFDGILELGVLSSDGNLYPSSNTLRSKNYIEVRPETTYTIHSFDNYLNFVVLFDSSKNVISTVSNRLSTNTFTTPSNCKYIKFGTYSTENAINTSSKFQIEKGKTNSSFVPHKDFGIVSASEKSSFMKLAPVERLVNPDLNNLEGNYMTYCLNATNVPESASVVYGFLIQLHVPGQNFKKQLWTSYNEDVWFKRSLVDNNWSAWKEL